MRVGYVSTFKDPQGTRAQATKILEEAAETFSAMERFERDQSPATREDVADECADVVQAVANLMAGLGYESMEGIMEDCYNRNERRGREYDD